MAIIESEYYPHRIGPPPDPFWTDQMLYWNWRAASEGLDGRGLETMYLFVTHSASYPSTEETFVQRYKWARLWELQAVFRRDFEPPMAFKWDGPEGTIHLDFEVEWGRPLRPPDKRLVTKADEAVAQWLRAHSTVWEAVLNRPRRYRNEVLCPGEPDFIRSFDFDGLNRKLAPYGVKVAPPPSH